MSEILDESEVAAGGDYLSEREIFTLIWTQPRRVFEFIHFNEYERLVPFLLVMAGITRGVEKVIERETISDESILPYAMLAILVGGLLGWVSFYLIAALIRWTGRWIGGQAATYEIVRVLAFAHIPTLLSLVLLILQWLIAGSTSFGSNGDILQWLPSDPLNLIFVVLQLILAVWIAVLYVVGNSVAQEFSIGKSILNLLLATLIPAVILAVIIYFTFSR